MNILYLNSLGSKKWGGGEKWMVVSAAALMARGHQVFICCRRGSVIEQKAQAKSINTIDFFLNTDLDFHKIPAFYKILKAHQVDVLICCQNKDVRIGARAARKAGTPAIFARQGVQNISNKRRYIKPFTQYVDGIITNTESIKKTYASYGWFPENFIHVVYNGIEMPRHIEPIDVHKKYGLPQSARVIASTGRLDPQKGFDLLVEVANMSKTQGLDWCFLVAGQGKSAHELAALAEKKGVTDRFKLVGFLEDVAAFVKSADVFVLPSRYEGMPNAALEAMALGKACVVTRVNGATELIEDRKSGILVEPENPEAIFLGIKEILSDGQLKSNLEEAALARVAEHFTIDKMTDRLEALFQEQVG